MAKEKMVYVVTHAKEDPERATFPLLLAVAALTMDVEAVVALQGEAVYLAVKGYADDLAAPKLVPVKQLLDSLLENGGRLLVCIPCLEHRNIAPEDLLKGAELTKAGKLVQEMLSANATAVY